jgi:hypothetical protein
MQEARSTTAWERVLEDSFGGSLHEVIDVNNTKARWQKVLFDEEGGHLLAVVKKTKIVLWFWNISTEDIDGYCLHHVITFTSEGM